jgi:hypothetical protein
MALGAVRILQHFKVKNNHLKSLEKMTNKHSSAHMLI